MPAFRKLAPIRASMPMPRTTSVTLGARLLADRGQGVRVRDLQREEGVRRVLDQLGALDVRHDDRRLEGLVEVAQDHLRAAGLDAEDDPVRDAACPSIADPSRRNSGFDATSKSTPFFAYFPMTELDVAAGADRHRALLDDQAVVAAAPGRCRATPTSMYERSAPPDAVRRRGHADEDRPCRTRRRRRCVPPKWRRPAFTFLSTSGSRPGS